MICTAKYLNVAGAGLCGLGSVFGIFSGGGTIATVGAAIATLGSAAWLVSALMDLAECLDQAGRPNEARQFRVAADRLQLDVDELTALVHQTV